MVFTFEAFAITALFTKLVLAVTFYTLLFVAIYFLKEKSIHTLSALSIVAFFAKVSACQLFAALTLLANVVVIESV